MQIGRRIYYDKFTGNVLVDTGERQGDVVETTIEQDFEVYKALSERNPETVGMIQLEFGQYAQDFRECNGFRVNLEELEFSYPEPNNPDPKEPVYQPPLSDMIKEQEQRISDLEIAVAAILGGATE